MVSAACSDVLQVHKLFFLDSPSAILQRSTFLIVECLCAEELTLKIWNALPKQLEDKYSLPVPISLRKCLALVSSLRSVRLAMKDTTSAADAPTPSLLQLSYAGEGKNSMKKLKDLFMMPSWYIAQLHPD